MRNLFVTLAAGAVGLVGPASARAADAPAPSAERGGETVRTLGLSPPGWSAAAYGELWKQWGLAEKPADYDRAVRDRYGLLPAAGGGLPVGLVKAPGPLGDGLAPTCTLCHAGAVAGKTYVGLGNASLDFQSLSADLYAASGLRLPLPFRFSHARGTIDPVTPVTLLARLRDPELNLWVGPGLLEPLPRDVLSKPPAWWQLRKKRTRDWTGVIDARSARIDLLTMLHPLHTAEHVKGLEPTFRDIHAFVLSVRPPAYPFPVDEKAAARGEAVFRDNCARCHGTYGDKWTYPNKVVPLDDLGTDPVLAGAIPDRYVEFANTTWLAREAGPDGRPYRFRPARGYQAPPLDGVWATAPYFHNASVPTLYHVLDSKARPKAFTRSYGTAGADYDPARVGVKFTSVDRPPDPGRPYAERRDVYDTTRRGHGNGGHTYGDDLTAGERADLVEYLKTL